MKNLLSELIFDEGRRAFQQHVVRADNPYSHDNRNPYSHDNRNHFYWDEGWVYAYKQDMDLLEEQYHIAHNS